MANREYDDGWDAGYVQGLRDAKEDAERVMYGLRARMESMERELATWRKGVGLETTLEFAERRGAAVK